MPLKFDFGIRRYSRDCNLQVLVGPLTSRSKDNDRKGFHDDSATCLFDLSNYDNCQKDPWKDYATLGSSVQVLIWVCR